MTGNNFVLHLDIVVAGRRPTRWIRRAASAAVSVDVKRVGRCTPHPKERSVFQYSISYTVFERSLNFYRSLNHPSQARNSTAAGLKIYTQVLGHYLWVIMRFQPELTCERKVAS